MLPTCQWRHRLQSRAPAAHYILLAALRIAFTLQSTINQHELLDLASSRKTIIIVASEYARNTHMLPHEIDLKLLLDAEVESRTL